MVVVVWAFIAGRNPARIPVVNRVTLSRFFMVETGLNFFGTMRMTVSPPAGYVAETPDRREYFAPSRNFRDANATATFEVRTHRRSNIGHRSGVIAVLSSWSVAGLGLRPSSGKGGEPGKCLLVCGFVRLDGGFRVLAERKTAELTAPLPPG